MPLFLIRRFVVLVSVASGLLGLAALTIAAEARAETTFANLQLPYGITTDANDNVFVTYDGTFTTYLTKFSPAGVPLDTISIGGITIGEVGRLATDPATGMIWDLSIEGNLRKVDPGTLDVQLLGNVRGVDVSTSNTHVWDAALDGFFDRSGTITPALSTFGDIALYRSENNTRLDVFLTARHTGHNVPYVLRLTFVNEEYQGATAVMTSTGIYSVNVPRGIAVGPSGRVVTTLPKVGRLGEYVTDQVISFPHTFPEHGVPTVELDRWDESSRGITADSAGNFYLTSQIQSSLCGVNAAASIMVLSPSLKFRACYPHSLLAMGEDVAVTASGDHVYSTVQSQTYLANENRVVDWGRLVNAGYTVGVQKSGAGRGTVTSTPNGISCGSACEAGFDSGAQVTLHAAPVSGSVFSGWSGGGCSGTADCVLTVDANKSVTATFASVGRQLAVTKSGFGRGTVTSSPAGIDCGPSCEAGFDNGSQVTLHAVPALGSAFGGWTGAGCSGQADCVLTMDADKAVSASFDSVGRRLTTSTSGNGFGAITSAPGGIACGAACSSVFDDGTPVTLHPAPAGGSVFSGWSGACSGQGDCFLTMDADKSLVGSFSLDAVQGPPATGGSPSPGGGSKSFGTAPVMIKGRGNGGTVRVSANRMVALLGVNVSCPAVNARSCSGAALLRTARAVNAEVQVDRRRKVTLGRTSFAIRPGASWKFRIRLSQGGMRLLRKLKSVNALAIISAGDGVTTATKRVGVKLKASRRR